MLRFVLAAAILLILVRVWSPPCQALTALDWLLVTALAATGVAGFNVLLVLAAQEGHPAMIATVLAAVPVVLGTVGPLLDGRKPRVPIVVGCVLVTAGTAITAGLGTMSAVGLALALGALLCDVSFTLFAVPLLPKLGPLRVGAYATAGAVPLLFLAGWVVDGTALLRLPTAVEATALAYQAIFVAVLATLLWYAALPGIRADRGGLAYGAMPAGAAVTALLLGQGAPEPSTLVGMSVAVGGLVVGLAWQPGQPGQLRARLGPILHPARRPAARGDARSTG